MWEMADKVSRGHFAAGEKRGVAGEPSDSKARASITFERAFVYAYAPKNSTKRFLISSVRRSSSSASTLRIFRSESFGLSGG